MSLTRRAISTLCLVLVILFAGGFRGASLNDDLVKAAKGGKTAKVKELLAKGASADARDKKGHSALSLAFTAEAYDTARVLLDSGSATLNAEPPLADFVLVWALQRNRMDIVEAMKAIGASAGNEHGRRAVNDTIRMKGGGDRETLLRLLSNGAPPGLALPESVGADGNTEVARILLDHGADVNVQRGATVLVRFDEREVSGGVPGAWMSVTGFTLGVGRDALMEAVMTDNSPLAQLLLDKGANPNRQMVVSDAKQVLNLPADVVTISFALLLTASVEATAGQTRMFSLMSKRTAKQLHPTKEVMSTPFCMAKARNHEEIVSLLVKHGGEGSCSP